MNTLAGFPPVILIERDPWQTIDQPVPTVLTALHAERRQLRRAITDCLDLAVLAWDAGDWDARRGHLLRFYWLKQRERQVDRALLAREVAE
jgi:hypothetical protein